MSTAGPRSGCTSSGESAAAALGNEAAGVGVQ